MAWNLVLDLMNLKLYFPWSLTLNFCRCQNKFEKAQKGSFLEITQSGEVLMIWNFLLIYFSLFSFWKLHFQLRTKCVFLGSVKILSKSFKNHDPLKAPFSSVESAISWNLLKFISQSPKVANKSSPEIDFPRNILLKSSETR